MLSSKTNALLTHTLASFWRKQSCYSIVYSSIIMSFLFPWHSIVWWISNVSNASTLKQFIYVTYWSLLLLKTKAHHIFCHLFVQSISCLSMLEVISLRPRDSCMRQQTKSPLIGSGNGLSPVRRQAIIWTNADIGSRTLGNKLQWNVNRN